MLYLHTLQIGNQSITFDCNIDCLPAEPEVGIMSASFEVTDIDVCAFGDHNRESHPGADSNWQQLSEMIEKLIDSDQDYRDELIEAACEENAERHLPV